MLTRKTRINKHFITRVFKKGRVVDSRYLTIKYLPYHLKAFSLVVSAKVSKQAVKRNFLKRRGRHIIYKHLDQIKDRGAYVIIFKPGSLNLTFKDLETEVMFLFKQII